MSKGQQTCQSISAVVQDEDGQVLAGPVFWNSPSLPGAHDTRFPCLRFVDPYGDTTFNQVQLPVLLADLRLLLESSLTNEEVADIRGMQGMIEPYVNNPHSYVKFIGD